MIYCSGSVLNANKSLYYALYQTASLTGWPQTISKKIPAFFPGHFLKISLFNSLLFVTLEYLSNKIKHNKSMILVTTEIPLCSLEIYNSINIHILWALGIFYLSTLEMSV